MSKLTPEEKQLKDDFEAGEFESVDDVAEEIARYRSYAADTLGGRKGKDGS